MRRARGRPPHARPWYQACAIAFILACLPAASFGAPLRVRPEKVHKDSVLDAAPHQFGFVCGVHFSGTSILHYALGLHPEVSIMHTAAVRMDEGQGFQDVMPTADTLGEAYLAKLHEATHPLTKESPGSKPPRTREVGRYFALDYSGRLDASSAAGNATRLRQQWQVLWDTNKRVLVEKSPPDLIRMRFLAAVFPPAWFVVIVRHPLAVCRRVEWRMRLLCAHNWLNAYEWGLQDIQEGQLRAHVTYYEDWARQPVKELQAMAGVTTLDRSDFNWSTVIREGADMNLKAHAASGWGYSGPLDEKGVPDVSRTIHVDPSRPLPDDHLAIDVAYADRPVLLARFQALEGRLNAFGYSFKAPFVTGCTPALRQRAACPGKPQ